MASAPALPDGFVLDAPAQAPANTNTPALPPGFVADKQGTADPGLGVYGSGGVEDNKDLGSQKQDDVPEGATDVQRDENGNLLGYRDGKTKLWTVQINGNATPAQVAGVADGTAAATARGVGDSATFGGLNRVASLVHATDDALHGGDFSDSYDQHLKQLQDVMHADEANHPVARGVGQIIGGLAIPVGLEGVGLKAGTSVLHAGGTIQEARAAAAIAVRNRMGVMGAGAGATHGYLNSDDLGSVDAAGNALEEGAIGAAGGLALGQAGAALSPRLAARAAALRGAPLTDAQKAAQAESDRIGTAVDAAKQEDIPISRPYVDPSVRNHVTYLETTKAGNPVVRDNLNAVSGAIEDRVGTLGGDGTAVTPEVAGQKLQNAGMAFIRDSGKRSSRLYTLAQSLAGNTKVVPKNALDTIDAQLADLKEAPTTNKAVIDYLTGLRSDLAKPGGLNIQTLRDIRTGVRGNLNQANLTQTNAERLAGDALGAASQDISSALSPEARAAYNAADTNYAERMGTIKNVVKGFLGPKDANISPEKAFAKFQAMASPKGDNARMSAMIKLLPPEDREDIAATFASDLGRDNKGNFSPTLLATQAKKLPDEAAKNLFGDEGAASLRRLALISNYHDQIVKNLNNSRTAVATNYRAWLPRALGLVVGGAGGALAHGPEAGAIGAYALQKGAAGLSDLHDMLSARALMNTDFTKWLAKAPASTRPQAARAYTNLLVDVAAKNPAIAPELLNLRQRLSDLLSTAPSRAAAGDDDKKGKK